MLEFQGILQVFIFVMYVIVYRCLLYYLKTLKSYLIEEKTNVVKLVCYWQKVKKKTTEKKKSKQK